MGGWFSTVRTGEEPHDQQETTARGRPGARSSGSGSGTPSAGRCGSPRTGTSPAPSSGRCAGPAVPIAFSQGFTPHPKISYASAAPTGVASEAEYLEIGLQARGRPGANCGPPWTPRSRPAWTCWTRWWPAGGQPRRPDRGVALAASSCPAVEPGGCAQRRSRRSSARRRGAGRAHDQAGPAHVRRAGRGDVHRCAASQSRTTFRGTGAYRVRYSTLSYGRSPRPYDPMTSFPACAWWPTWSRRSAAGDPAGPGHADRAGGDRRSVGRGSRRGSHRRALAGPVGAR